MVAALSLFRCARLQQGGARVRVSSVSRGRRRREKGRGFVGSCLSRRRAAAAGCRPLFRNAGLEQAGARVRVLGGSRLQREMEKRAGLGGSGRTKK